MSTHNNPIVKAILEVMQDKSKTPEARVAIVAEAMQWTQDIAAELERLPEIKAVLK